MPTTPATPQPITRAPPELVSTRFLAAEAAAGAALALVQSHAVWSSLQTMALLLEAHEEPAMSDGQMAALAELVEGSMIEPKDMTAALNALDVLDRNARSWGEQAHPHARPGVARLQLVGTVS